jgi:hypothetical protein
VTDRIVIAGASGFIGSYLQHAFEADGVSVSTIGRSGADVRWGDARAIAQLLEGADILVNLAGKSVNCRYNAENRAEILRSRIETTRELTEAVAACEHPPALWVNSSTATIYRHAEDHAMTEKIGEIGTGFSVGIATAWEGEFFVADLQKTRRIALRMAIVLGGGSVVVPPPKAHSARAGRPAARRAVAIDEIAPGRWHLSPVPSKGWQTEVQLDPYHRRLLHPSIPSKARGPRRSDQCVVTESFG